MTRGGAACDKVSSRPGAHQGPCSKGRVLILEKQLEPRIKSAEHPVSLINYFSETTVPKKD